MAAKTTSRTTGKKAGKPRTKPPANATGKATRTRRKPGGRKRRTKADRSASARKGAETRAKRAAERAREAGATGTGKRLAAAQMHLRDSAILACLDAGWTQAEAAKELDTTTRCVQRAVKRRTEQPSPIEARPMALVENHLKALAADVRDAQLIAWATVLDQPHVSLGAKRLAREARAEMNDLLVQLGKVPDDLSTLRAEAEWSELVGAMIAELNDLAEGRKDVGEVLSAFEAMVYAGDPRDDGGAGS